MASSNLHVQAASTPGKAEKRVVEVGAGTMTKKDLQAELVMDALGYLWELNEKIKASKGWWKKDFDPTFRSRRLKGIVPSFYVHGQRPGDSMLAHLSNLMFLSIADKNPVLALYFRIRQLAGHMCRPCRQNMVFTCSGHNCMSDDSQAITLYLKDGWLRMNYPSELTKGPEFWSGLENAMRVIFDTQITELIAQQDTIPFDHIMCQPFTIYHALYRPRAIYFETGNAKQCVKQLCHQLGIANCPSCFPEYNPDPETHEGYCERAICTVMTAYRDDIFNFLDVPVDQRDEIMASIRGAVPAADAVNSYDTSWSSHDSSATIVPRSPASTYIPSPERNSEGEFIDEVDPAFDSDTESVVDLVGERDMSPSLFSGGSY